jgi:hypothetical protein
MAVAKVMRTRDGRYRIYIYDDHTALMCDQRGKTILGRTEMYKISERLAELDVRGDDLIED